MNFDSGSEFLMCGVQRKCCSLFLQRERLEEPMVVMVVMVMVVMMMIECE